MLPNLYICTAISSSNLSVSRAPLQPTGTGNRRIYKSALLLQNLDEKTFFFLPVEQKKSDVTDNENYFLLNNLVIS